MNAQAALNSYQKVHVDAGVQSASSHRLVDMLFEGLLARIAQAKGSIQQKNIEMKGKKITQAISIVLALKDSLNLEKGGEVAANLDALYDYVQRTLWQANMKSDCDLLDECGRLIAPVASAWKEIS